MSGKTLPRPRPAKDTEASGPGVAVSGKLARQRRPGWIAAGVMFLALAVLTNVYLFRSSGERVPVVRVARDVPVGQQISRADLDVARVAADATVATVPGRQLGEVVGRWAAVGLRKGTLLTASQLAAQVSPAPGQALVTVPLKASQVPPGLAPGWRVRVVSTPGAQGKGTTALEGGASASGGKAAAQGAVGVVDQVGKPGPDGSVTVSLLVADADSGAVARRAAAGLVALVVTARRG